MSYEELKQGEPYFMAELRAQAKERIADTGEKLEDTPEWKAVLFIEKVLKEKTGEKS